MLSLIIKAIATSFGVFLFTLFLSRIIGRKLVSQMTFFDYIVGIMIGSAAVQAAELSSIPSLSSLITLIVICLMSTLIDIIHVYSMRTRKFIDSEPVIVISHGQIIDKNMRKVRLTIDELNMMLREQGYFNIADVENAIIETNGELSVQLKAEKQPLTPSDMSITPDYKGLTRDLIMDGKILDNNLSYINKNERWLRKQLLHYGVHDLKEVFYAGLDSSDNLYVSKRQHNKEEAGQHGIE